MKGKFMRTIAVTMSISMFALTACGGNAESNEARNYESRTSENVESEENVSTSSTFSEVLKSEGRTVWFITRYDEDKGVIGKESNATPIIFENGKMTYYSKVTRYLGEYAKMSDDEIIADAKKRQLEEMKSSLEDDIESLQNTINGGMYKEELAENKEKLKYYQSFKIDDNFTPKSFCFSVETDTSGNITKTETIYFMKSVFKQWVKQWRKNSGEGEGEDEDLDYSSWTFNYPKSPDLVYDTLYAGFSDADGEDFLITKVNENFNSFTIDQLGNENVLVDPDISQIKEALKE